MSATRIEHSSLKDDWRTPDAMFSALHNEFNFTIDLAAAAHNAKLPRFCDKKSDGLKTSIKGERVFCNPPYGRTSTGRWVEKVATGGAEVAVMIIPASTSTRWFHKHIYQKPGVEIRFVKGRVRFMGGKNTAPHSTMIVIFYEKTKNTPLHRA